MSESSAPFSIDDFRERARRRLRPVPAPDSEDDAEGDHVFTPNLWASNVRPRRRPAAVLAAIVPHEGEATILLTQRAARLREHAGQIALPGGKIDPGDASPLAAALREAQEEVGLDPALVTPLGYLDPYLTGTGFRIHPVIAMVDPRFTLTLNPDEVEDVFETPLEFLMNPLNHLRHSRVINGVDRAFNAMPWRDRYIWGATAGILRNLYLRLYGA